MGKFGHGVVNLYHAKKWVRQEKRGHKQNKPLKFNSDEICDFQDKNTIIQAYFCYLGVYFVS